MTAKQLHPKYAANFKQALLERKSSFDQLRGIKTLQARNGFDCTNAKHVAIVLSDGSDVKFNVRNVRNWLNGLHLPTRQFQEPIYDKTDWTHHDLVYKKPRKEADASAGTAESFAHPKLPEAAQVQRNYFDPLPRHLTSYESQDVLQIVSSGLRDLEKILSELLELLAQTQKRPA